MASTPRASVGEVGFPQEEFTQRCARLYREHNQALLDLLNARLRSWPDAKDVAQEAYVRVFQLYKYGAVEHLRGLLFKTALNLATDRIRERARRARDAHFVVFHSARGEVPSAELQCIADQDWSCLQRAVEQLPPKCRLAFTLVEFDCRPVDEVAADLNIKPNTVYQLLKRAYEHLAKSVPPAASDSATT